MALDHYVSQVHLKNFCSPALTGERMYAVDKRTLKRFEPRPKDVCRVEEGNTNAYLKENERAIEEFLKFVEPRYNTAVEQARSGTLSEESIAVISGFVAYVTGCSPNATRHYTPQLSEIVKSTLCILERQGKIPPAPKELLEGLGVETIAEMLESDMIRIKVNPKYPQSIGITSIFKNIWMFGNFEWNIIINNSSTSPFFTSDYPIALERSNEDPSIINKIVPLAPDIAVRILPKRGFRPPDPLELKFPRFRFSHKEASGQLIRHINALIVKCAEETVFFRNDSPWVFPFIKKHAGYWTESVVRSVRTETGFGNLSALRIAERPKDVD